MSHFSAQRMQGIVAAILLFATMSSSATETGFTFSIIASAGTNSTMTSVRDSLSAADAENLAFVVVNRAKPPLGILH